jgi:hypothetical protein
LRPEKGLADFLRGVLCTFPEYNPAEDTALLLDPVAGLLFMGRKNSMPPIIIATRKIAIIVFLLSILQGFPEPYKYIMILMFIRMLIPRYMSKSVFH